MGLSLDHFKTRTRPVADWIIPGWLKRRNTGFILGEPKKACKSWMLLNMAWDLSEGRHIWGITGDAVFQPKHATRVVYFSQEDTEDDLQDRIELLFGDGRMPNDNLCLVPKDLSKRFDSKDGIRLIEIELNEARDKMGGIDLIIFDPMRRMHAKSENDSEVIAELWRTLDLIHKVYNCSTIFSHHTVKPSRDAFSNNDATSPHAARGSGDIFGGGDAFINVVAGKRVYAGGKAMYQSSMIHFETKRGRPIPCMSIQTSFDTGRVSFVGWGKTDGPALDEPVSLVAMGK